MKFIVNTAFDPHFCAIFSEENKLLSKKVWIERATDGKNVFDFLKENPAKFSFCGGVSGPGGFTSLRVSANVLTSISLVNSIPIHQISAEKFLSSVLGHNDFLLNSFGKAVWKYENNKISRDFIQNIYKEKKWFVNLLPLEKQKEFPNKIIGDLDDIEQKLLECLLETEPVNVFIPHYEVAPV